MQNSFSLKKSSDEDMVLIWDRVNVLKRSECPSAVSLNCGFIGYLLKLGMFTQIRAQSGKALSLLPGRPAVARKAERQLLSLNEAHFPWRGLPLSPEGTWAPPPATSSASQGCSPGPLSCCEVCACTTENPFSCGFRPCHLFSAVSLWFVQTVLLRELCCRTCSQDREEQRWLYGDAHVGGMSSVYASFCTGVLQGTVFSVIIWAVVEGRTFGLAQRFVTPVTA